MAKLGPEGVAAFLSGGVAIIEGGITGPGDLGLRATGREIQKTNYAGPQKRGLSYAASIVTAPTSGPA